MKKKHEHQMESCSTDMEQHFPWNVDICPECGMVTMTVFYSYRDKYYGCSKGSKTIVLHEGDKP